MVTEKRIVPYISKGALFFFLNSIQKAFHSSPHLILLIVLEGSRARIIGPEGLENGEEGEPGLLGERTGA